MTWRDRKKMRMRQGGIEGAWREGCRLEGDRDPQIRQFIFDILNYYFNIDCLQMWQLQSLPVATHTWVAMGTGYTTSSPQTGRTSTNSKTHQTAAMTTASWR